MRDSFLKNREIVDKETARTRIARYLAEFHNVGGNPFHMVNINTEHPDRIYAHILFKKQLYRYDYMETVTNMRRLCSVLAEDFRDMAAVGLLRHTTRQTRVHHLSLAAVIVCVAKCALGRCDEATCEKIIRRHNKDDDDR